MTKKAICSCKINLDEDITTENQSDNGNKENKILRKMNFKHVICYNLIIKWNYNKYNIGFWFWLLMFVILQLIIIIYITKGRE